MGRTLKGDAIGGPIRWRIHIPAPPDRVFDVLTTDAGRARFWADTAEREGLIEFRYRNGYICESRILERRPQEVFSIEYFGGTARFDLTPDGDGGTDLLLTHTGVQPDEWNEVHAGWLNVLFPLKGWVAFGIDLRNHDPLRSWEAGYVDQ